MKKLILILGIFTLSCSVESEAEIQELNSELSGISLKGNNNDKITICHFDTDNNGVQSKPINTCMIEIGITKRKCIFLQKVDINQMQIKIPQNT